MIKALVIPLNWPFLGIFLPENLSLGITILSLKPIFFDNTYKYKPISQFIQDLQTLNPSLSQSAEINKERWSHTKEKYKEQKNHQKRKSSTWTKIEDKVQSSKKKNWEVQMQQQKKRMITEEAKLQTKVTHAI